MNNKYNEKNQVARPKKVLRFNVIINYILFITIRNAFRIINNKSIERWRNL